MRIDEIRDPSFLKDMTLEEIIELCKDIRTFLLNSISKTGGHLSSNLGVVEISTMLLKIFDAPKDKIIYDVGHQCYVHKILTGRAKDFHTLRQGGGIAGFQKKHESIYDCWEAGHSSTSLSAALGMALSRDAMKEDHHVVAVIGDGALNNGMAFEALNHIGELRNNLIIILNDNNMSISRPVGGFTKVLSSIRTSEFYIESKSDIRNSLMKSKNGKILLEKLIRMRRTIKKKLFKDSLFYDFGVDYLGPIDGHNVYELERALQMAKSHNGPILVHVLTDKGKGYQPAEQDTNGDWHGVGPFDVESAKKLGGLKEGYVSYSQAVTEYLVKRGESDEKLFVITPAMIAGSQLQEFFAKYPERSIDCGIAEEHAVTLGAGLANGGMHPFVSIYSSFMQRAYDQINHDVARMNLPVVFGVDRAGIVGEDGETHHGVFDISFLRSIPNVVIAHPKDYAELHAMLHTGFKSNCPFFVRYPRGNTKRMDVSNLEEIPVGSFDILHKVEDPKLIVFTYGEETIRMVESVREQNLPIIFVNARYLKPLDEVMLADLLQYDCDWLCVEDGMLIGGLGEALLGYVSDHGVTKRVHRRGITDHFVRHASMSELRDEEHISGDSMLDAIKELIK